MAGGAEGRGRRFGHGVLLAISKRKLMVKPGHPLEAVLVLHHGKTGGYTWEARRERGGWSAHGKGLWGVADVQLGWVDGRAGSRLVETIHVEVGESTEWRCCTQTTADVNAGEPLSVQSWQPVRARVTPNGWGYVPEVKAGLVGQVAET